MTRRVGLAIGLWSLVFPVGARAASMSFEPERLKAGVGTRQEVKLVVDASGDRLVGVDAKIVWPGQLVRLVEVSDLRGFSKLLGRKDASGRVDLAFGNEYGVLSQGRVEVANLVFESIGTGGGEIALEFVQGSTTDSNVVAEGGGDVLSEVKNAKVEIGKVQVESDKKAEIKEAEKGLVLGVQAGAASTKIEWLVWVTAGGMMALGLAVYRRAKVEV